MKKSVAFRLSFRFMLLFAAIVTLLSTTFVLLLRNKIFRNQRFMLHETAVLLGAEVENGYEPVPELLGLPYFVTYVIYGKENQNVYFTNDPLLPLLPETNGKSKKYFQKDYFIDGNLNILYFAVESEISGVPVIIETAMDVAQDSSAAMVNEIPRLLLFVFLPILLISFLLSLLITKRTLLPVEKITQTAQKISSSNLEVLLPVGKEDNELNQLAKTFNDLFQSLKKDFDRERSFTSDVSHELKTPVAGILGQANLLQRWGKEDPKQLEESLNLIITEANSMNSIITNLLQMSKLEHGIVKIQKEELNLWAMYSRLKNEFGVINPDIKITFDDSIDVTLMTDGELLHQVLTALISNSIKYGATEIQLKGQKDDDKVEILELDNGPGFKEEVLPHVFERFYRGDNSHNRGAGGAGLGLSISQTIIQALEGTITAENRSDCSGALLKITL